MNYIKPFVAALLLLAGLSGTKASANFLINGNFESNSLSDPFPSWESIYNGPDQPVQPQNQFEVTSAANIGFLPGNGAQIYANFFDGALKQDVNLAANGLSQGQQLTLSGQVYLNQFFNDPVNGPLATSTSGWNGIAQLAFLNNGTQIALPISLSLSPGTGITQGQWVSFSGTATIPFQATDCRVIIGQVVANPALTKPSSPTGFDNIALNIAGVPEPGTYGMLILGLCGMIPVIRRKLKQG